MPTIEEAIAAAREDDLLRAYTMFLDIYGADGTVPLQTPKTASGLSWFGLSMALIKREYKNSIDLCRRAIDVEFYNGDHYANLARVYLAAGNRKKAVEIAEQGLKNVPEHGYLIRVRESLGVRSRPAVPFLTRENPINVSLGQARHAKKVADEERRKPKPRD